MLSNPACAMPSSVVNDFWVSFSASSCATGYATEYLGHFECNSGLEGSAAANNGAPG